MHSMIRNSIISKSMHHFPSLNGGKGDGSTMKIPGDGFSGTADIIWEEGVLMMKDR